MRYFRLLIGVLSALLPWFMKRRLLRWLWGYQLSPTARIGVSLVIPDSLIMGEGSRIASGVVIIHLTKVVLGERASINRGCWITAYPLGEKSSFGHLPNRSPALYVGPHSAITKNHHIDCTEEVRIGSFTTIAGYQSQFLSHSMNLMDCRQDAAPIAIGDYCFIGTGVVMLPGSAVANYTIVAAGAVVTQRFDSEYSLIGGVPARIIKQVPADMGYFVRTKGYVN